MSEYAGQTVADWYKKYFSQVFRLCLKMLRNIHDAEEAIQDVYLKLIEKERRGKDLREIGSESGYLKTIAYNLCLDRLDERKRKYGDCYSLMKDEMLMDHTEENENEKKNQEEKEKAMIRAIVETRETVSEETRLIYCYYYIEDLKLKDIAKKVGKSTSLVQKKLEAFRQRARRRLEENLK